MQLELFYIEKPKIDLSEHTKECKCCNEVKPLDSFRKQFGYAKGRYHVCRKCFNEQQNLRRHLKKNVPLPPKNCECCGKESKLGLDHCHETKQFRGWLCTNCNVGMGKLQDSVEGVKKALAYLERYNKKGRI